MGRIHIQWMRSISFYLRLCLYASNIGWFTECEECGEPGTRGYILWLPEKQYVISG
jgi:hypothetical protein